MMPAVTAKAPSRLQAARERQQRRRIAGQIVFAVIGAAVGYGLSRIPPGDGSIILPLIGALGGWALTQRSAKPPSSLSAWAETANLTEAAQPLPAVTPLLLQPWGRTDWYAEGSHPGGFSGRFGVFNFVRPVRFYVNSLMQLITRFTWPEPKGVSMLVAVTELPGSAAVTPVLLCERRYGGRLLDSVEDAARDLERVQLESVQLDERYELFAERGQDPIMIRRILSPSLVVWLGEEVEHTLAFEIFEDSLCIAAPVESLKDLSSGEMEEFAGLAGRLDARIRAELGVAPAELSGASG